MATNSPTVKYVRYETEYGITTNDLTFELDMTFICDLYDFILKCPKDIVFDAAFSDLPYLLKKYGKDIRDIDNHDKKKYKEAIEKYCLFLYEHLKNGKTIGLQIGEDESIAIVFEALKVAGFNVNKEDIIVIEQSEGYHSVLITAWKGERQFNVKETLGLQGELWDLKSVYEKTNELKEFHPCTTAPAIIRAHVENFTREGELVFDGFMGSETTAIVCHGLKRHYIGVELYDWRSRIDEPRRDLVEKARKRNTHPIKILFEDSYSATLPLFGEDYHKIKKGVFWTILGNTAKSNGGSKETFKDIKQNYSLIILKDGQWIDTRIPIIFAMGSGDGKKEIVYNIKRIQEALGRKVVCPVSYHSEQVIGGFKIKKIEREKDGEKETETKFEPRPGALSSDWVVFDEADDFVSAYRYEEARKYVRLALDTIGMAQLEKGKTAAGASILHYYSDSNVTLLTQPLRVDTSFVKMGLGRRYLIIPYVAPLSNKLEIVEQRLKTSTKAKDVDEFVSIIQSLVKKVNVEFDSEAIDFIVQESKNLARELMSLNDRAEGYVRIIAIDIENTLLKMASIAARIREPIGRVTLEDCEAVREDWRMLYQNTVEYVLTYVSGDFSYSGLSGREIVCLRLLEGSIDEKSGIKPIEFYDKIASKFGIEKDSARKQYYDKLKERHLIETKGGKEAKAWLSEEGKKILEFGKFGSIDDQE